MRGVCPAASIEVDATWDVHKLGHLTHVYNGHDWNIFKLSKRGIPGPHPQSPRELMMLCSLSVFCFWMLQDLLNSIEQ